MRYTDQEYEESDTEEELGPGEAVNTHLLRGPGTSHRHTHPHLHAANITVQGATKPWALEQSVLYRRRSKCFYVVSFKFICFFGNFYKWGIVCLSVFLYDGWDVHKWVSFAAMPLRILFCLKCF